MFLVVLFSAVLVFLVFSFFIQSFHLTWYRSSIFAEDVIKFTVHVLVVIATDYPQFVVHFYVSCPIVVS